MKTKYKIAGFNIFGFLTENPEPNVKLQFLIKSFTGLFAGYSMVNAHPDYLVTIGICGFVLDTLACCLIFEEIK